MGFPAHKLQVVLGELAPDLLGVLAAPRDAKLNLGAGGDEHGTDAAFLNIDNLPGYPDGKQTDPRGITRAKADISGYHHGSDLRSLVSPGSAEVIYTHHVLEHIPYQDARDVLRMWADLLKPGGVLYVCVPEPFWLIAHALGRRDILPPQRYWNGDTQHIPHHDGRVDAWELANDLIYSGGDHVSFWWPQALKQALEMAGLHRVQQYLPQGDPNGGWLGLCELTMIGVKR